ncbi:MAG: hypothetical protein P1V51_14820 [Deltaproteobacteria bacterium]|nr:hypothetical protein [Deltaproteobacteria bacterium]
MLPELHPCSLCGDAVSEESGLPEDRPAVCAGCCGRLVELVGHLDFEVLARLWRFETDPRGVVERWAEGDLEQQGWILHDLPAEAFADEGGTHADLALAYLEMGLRGDAFNHAVLALTTGPQATALEVLFGPRLARSRLVVRLRELLFPN